MKPRFVLVALFAAAAFSGSAIAHEEGEHAHAHPGLHGDGEKMAAAHAKHHARLHDRLKLTAQQEPAWKAFTEKTKPDPARRKAVREEMAKLTTPERLDRMQALMKERDARMAEHIAAVKEFYAQLSAEQQKVFDEHVAARHDAGKRPAREGKGPAATK